MTRMNCKGLLMVTLGVTFSWVILTTSTKAQQVGETVCTAPLLSKGGTPITAGANQLCQKSGQFVVRPADPPEPELEEPEIIHEEAEPEISALEPEPVREAEYIPPPPPPPESEAAVRKNFIVYFNPGSINPNNTSEIEEVTSAIQHLQEREDLTILIRGYADTEGSNARNMTLSQQRGETIRDVLNAANQHGTPYTINITAFGEENLPVQTPDDVNEPANRRVEIELCPTSVTVSGECNTF